jgi:hypothetical protein
MRGRNSLLQLLDPEASRLFGILRLHKKLPSGEVCDLHQLTVDQKTMTLSECDGSCFYRDMRRLQGQPARILEDFATLGSNQGLTGTQLLGGWPSDSCSAILVVTAAVRIDEPRRANGCQRPMAGDR